MSVISAIVAIINQILRNLGESKRGQDLVVKLETTGGKEEILN